MLYVCRPDRPTPMDRMASPIVRTANSNNDIDIEYAASPPPQPKAGEVGRCVKRKQKIRCRSRYGGVQ